MSLSDKAPLYIDHTDKNPLLDLPCVIESNTVQIQMKDIAYGGSCLKGVRIKKV